MKLQQNNRARIWQSSKGVNINDTFSRAHKDSGIKLVIDQGFNRVRREEAERLLSPGATKSFGAGNRAVAEKPDLYRTCFEVDRDRIVHKSPAFRRLAGKTQVFIFPEDHMRTRLTHALEVTQISRAIAQALNLNVPLAEAIALGHDCGHGPFGHTSEDALSPYLSGGFDHAVFGADSVLRDLNLTEETLDGIRNHSWSRPAPKTPEGEVVSWADRIAYVCHDFEDATSAGIITAKMLPESVAAVIGLQRGHQLDRFINDIIDATYEIGEVAMSHRMTNVLNEFRQFNYEKIYNRPASIEQSQAVVPLLQNLVDYFIDRPNSDRLTDTGDIISGSEEAIKQSVQYVAGMTDRFAVRTASSLLGWPTSKLPRGIDLGTVGL